MQIEYSMGEMFMNIKKMMTIIACASALLLAACDNVSTQAASTDNADAEVTCESTDVVTDQDDVDRKPVIYLYPKKDNTEIAINLDYNGTFTETIPEIQENVWRVIANKNGEIFCDDETYPYIYWEGMPNYEYDFFTGYCIKGEDTKSFLDEQLPKLGLNKAEATEFTSYWLPQMEKNPYNIISFQEKTYTENAKLTIVPAPDTTIRVFMAWYPSDHYIRISPQLIDTPVRKGFTVVEWGGNKVK